MKIYKDKFSKRIGPEPNDRTLITYDKIEFESIGEAVAFLGEETALKYLNYAQDLNARARLYHDTRDKL